MYTIGADPELFIRDNRSGGVTPACDIFGGTKGAPVPLGNLPEGFGLQEDNVMLEFNIPPAKGVWDLVEYMQRAREALDEIVRTSGDFEIDKSASRLFHRNLLTNSKAQEFGCSPDFNAYAGGAPIQPLDRTLLVDGDGEWRFAGGHIHIGYNNPDIPHHVVGALCDAIIACTVVEDDIQGKRRTFYGSAGRYRPTSYGIEYRTLSNFWIWEDGLVEHIANRVHTLCSILHEVPVGVLQRAYIALNWGDIRECINTEDVEMSFRTCDHISMTFEQEGITNGV